jgi:hypothetical protein
MDREDKIAFSVIIILALIIGFLFAVPVQDGKPVLTVENGDIRTNIGGGGGIGDIDGDTGNGGAGDNEEPQTEPCEYPESFDIPAGSNWWFAGHSCPDSVRDFFSGSDDIDCFEVRSTGNVYDQRGDVVDYYDDYLEDLNWEKIDTESGYVNEQNCWAWGGLYYCEHDDKGMIAIFVFCPKTSARDATGAFGQTVGGWEYIAGKAENLNEIIDRLLD